MSTQTQPVWLVSMILPPPSDEQVELLVRDPEIYSYDHEAHWVSMCVTADTGGDAVMAVGSYLRNLFRVEVVGGTDIRSLKICGAEKDGDVCLRDPHDDADHSSGLKKWSDPNPLWYH